MLSELESSIGIFTLYTLIISLGLLFLTIFVNFVRGIILTGMGISLAYYLLIASPQVKTEMDTYIKSIATSITGSTTSSIKKSAEAISSNISNKVESIGESYADGFKKKL